MIKQKDLAAAAALADSSVLDDFDGREVVRTNIAITNAGDGLSAALAVQPQQLVLGQEVTIVLRGTVTKVGFVPADDDEPDDGPLVRVHTIRAGSSTILSEAAAKKVAGAISQQELAIKRAVEAARGIAPLRNGLVSVDDPTPGEPGADDLDPDDEPDPI